MAAVVIFLAVGLSLCVFGLAEWHRGVTFEDRAGDFPPNVGFALVWAALGSSCLGIAASVWFALG